MPKPRLIWQIFFSFITVIVLTITAIAVYMAGSMKKLYLYETSDNLKARSILFIEELRFIELEESRADSLCKKLGDNSATRFTVILPSGKVIGDTYDDPTQMENHANRPEIVEALSGHTGVSTRYSHTQHETMMYVALPVTRNNNVVGVVCSAISITTIDKTFSQIYPKIIFGGLVIAMVSGVISFYLSRRISIPLERMKRIAEAYSKGDFGHKLSTSNSVEIDALADALNRMASELDEKINAITNQRNELGAILSSMIEGVLTFDTDLRLIAMNQAASKILGFDKNAAKGRYIQEVIRYAQIQKMVSQILDIKIPLEVEIETETGRILRVHGNILRNDRDESLGVLLVLNDITQLRHLERVRRDFVANVSHELRTPITSIKGFVETLQEGAIANPEDARRFLDIIKKQADRLNSIIAGLLALSKIEETEKGEMPLEEHNIKLVLVDAIAVCEAKAGNKKVEIDLDVDEALSGKINQELLEQAVVNLLDNAINYSGEGGKVFISAFKADSDLTVKVQDWGIGIEKKHIPRLFERFYTVDKARSREMGGSGLGLAIVKHITLAHHGTVSVQSFPGKGSTFSIQLPC